MSKATIARVPFADGERFEMMWGCCGGTHQGSWQNNGNDYYAGGGTVCVAPISGTVVRAGAPPLGQGDRVGIQGDGKAVYMAHMQDLRVDTGDRVKVGDPVGEVWAFPNMPDHLHFSLASGDYGSGSFVDPWSQVADLGIHIDGRLYEAGDGTPDKPKAPRLLKVGVEELPARMGGLGPDVYGPWRDTPANRRRRDQRVETMRANGRLVAPMRGRQGDLYIFEYASGTYGRPYRWGMWSIDVTTKDARKVLDARRDKAITALMSDGRLTKPRKFQGEANSLYPAI